jgi:penicillin-binding protein 2
LPSPQVNTTSAPEPKETAERFLEHWRKNDFSQMYGLISTANKNEISEEEFIKRYEDVSFEAAINEITFRIIGGQTKPGSAEVTYKAILHSTMVGDIHRDYVMNLEFENSNWGVIWDETLILPELTDGNYLRMEYQIPVRSSIYDRYGNPLASQAEATAIGLYPDFVDYEEDTGLIALLSRVTGIQRSLIRGMIKESLVGAYLPIGEIVTEDDPRQLDILSSYGAVVTSPYDSRLYPGGGIGPHVIGYVSAIQEDELAQYRREGYQGSERIGRDGVEKWGNSVLGGVNGGSLYVFNSEEKPIKELGSKASEVGRDIYTTLDGEFQASAQQSLLTFNGAVVVLERDTGRVLAMVSSPSFNPNAFEFNNVNWSAWLSDITTNPNQPQYNRGTRGVYPLGSVFKVITMAAALESGRYTADTIYECGYVFDELAGFPRYDWTYDRFLEDEITRPSGTLTLQEGLIRSCNPYFWHIGLDLFNAGLTTAISDMARGFGLGSLSGIEVLEEESGQIPDPESVVDAINLAIGQGDMLVTPLQVASFMAALGNGGTLYRPQVIEQIDSLDGSPEFTFEPEINGTLPVSSENLQIIKEAMKGVVSSENPIGTAYRAFNGLEIPVAGKTGTATSGSGEPHSWFAGYTLAGREDRPDIAIAVIVENIGEGSNYAAPVFRRIVELYFYGQPQKLYRWEGAINATKTPTPIVTLTPTPRP